MVGKEGGTASLLPLNTSQAKRPRIRNLLVAICLAICIFKAVRFVLPETTQYRGEGKNYCPQSEELTPKKNSKVWTDFTEILGKQAFKERAVDWLAGAVRVPTETYDDFAPVGEDPRWEKFSKFYEYLSSAFPKVHATLELTKVNSYGLMYVWKGRDTSLKPILLMAHQDVVPVEPTTWDSWKHPPFSGYFDGERIWGRGSSDDKSGLIGIMSAVELLIENNFQPTRTVVLAFGFDEELTGTQGAGTLATVLEARFGKDGFAFLIDEGTGFSEQYGAAFATIGIAEKGYFDVKVEVATAGGHSSVPPPHTSIGILSSLLVHYERHPFTTRFLKEDPLYSTLLCYAEHAQSMPKRLANLIEESKRSDKAMLLLEKHVFKNTVWKSQVGTTQAIDIIHGGVKSNALPERAYAIVNHRISVLSSVAATQEYDASRAKTIASRYNLTLNAFGSDTNAAVAPSSGVLTLSDAYNVEQEPAPITPTDAAPYQLVSGTIKATYNSHRGLQGSTNIHVMPGMSTGNTDTYYYWRLSKHILRYNHHDEGNGPIHTVNESMSAEAFLEMIRFFGTLILNSDESLFL
ncbi:hypothetical protein M378DRAFT_1065315 [Amanita muscaria Koide BX008]|uniref:Peptidase M20 dimerisation domain-containing protein n=1 Tax=Amanita muscaria (strain Koide BX008) TaxID=946122 RepID=A0A0C2WU41_AMAMK|nr:hypothetical protein M378DRAFT_1065315 [Amanita muscaria Koide BX008]